MNTHSNGFLMIGTESETDLKLWCRDLPGGPVAKTCAPNANGPGFNPWSGY